MNNKYDLLTISTSPELKVRHKTSECSPIGSIIFVHGICHGAWCFENFMDFFSENGYECFALNLRGHGDNNRNDLIGARLSDYTDDVKKCVEYCTDYCNKKGITEKPFLLGHSMGGAVVQKYIGDYFNTVKGAILLASATAPKMNIIETMTKTMVVKSLRLAAYVSYGFKLSDKQIASTAFFDNRVSQKDINRYKNLLQRESYLITTMDLYKIYTRNFDINIPLLVIGSEADKYFPRKSLIKTISMYRYKATNTLVILENLCHDMMLDPEWKESAESILNFMMNCN